MIFGICRSTTVGLIDLPIVQAEKTLSPVFAEQNERKIIFILCCVAAIHVFIFSAAFPFFTNIDEPIHFDLVVKYSHGHVPRKLETLSPDSSIYLSLYSSLAYFGTPDSFPDQKLPSPPWTQSVEKMQHDLVLNSAAWQAQQNFEVSQPPLYYALAGLWWHIGKWCGFEGGRLLYWLRFLNILVAVALVWIGYVAAKLIFPGHLFLRMAVPTWLAFLPQSAFYSIENDVLSPLCFGLLLVCTYKWMCADVPSARLGFLTGSAFAATFLAKLTNLPLLMVTGVFIFFKTWHLHKDERLRVSCPALAAFSLSAGLPMAFWLAWCKYNFGDFSGSELKIEHFGWIHKPFSEWWHHPIFMPGGLWTFVSGLMSTFWQGEFWWHNKPMALPIVDMIYTITSICFVVMALIAHFSKTATETKLQHQALLFAFCSFVAMIAFFGFLSIIYDFNGCPNPSREHPYFTSGRLMLGSLIPFLLVFAYGLDHALSHFGSVVKFSALAGMIFFMLTSEIIIDWPAFSNEFNWFHL
jgi:hypothetical protein